MIRCIVAIALSIFSVSVWADYDVQLMPGEANFSVKTFQTVAQVTAYLHSFGYLSSLLTPVKDGGNVFLKYVIPIGEPMFPGTVIAKDTTYSANFTSYKPTLEQAFWTADCYNDDNCKPTYTQIGDWQRVDDEPGSTNQSTIHDKAFFNVVADGKHFDNQEVDRTETLNCTPPSPDHIVDDNGDTYATNYQESATPDMCTIASISNLGPDATFFATAYNKEVANQSCSAAGDPVDLANGSVSLNTTDLVVNSPFPIVIKRHYSSKMGWQFSYTDYVLSGQVYNAPDGGMYVFESNGLKLVFDGFNHADNGAKGTFSASDAGASYSEPSGMTLAFTPPSGQSTLSAGVVSKLTETISKYGFHQSVTYDSQGNIDGVSDTFGHKVAITSHDGKFDSVTDPNGNTIHYTYDKNGNLTQVTWPSGRTVYYQYGDSAHPTLLTAVLDSNKKVVSSWTYDSEGRAITNTQEQ